MAVRSDQVALLAGAAEGFALLANLRPTLAAVIAPSFTEPDVALRSAGVAVQHVVLDPPFGLDGARVPDEADLVVVGNPTNPTAVLHTREQILALRRPGRIVVVDEAFADAVPGEPESLADESPAGRTGAAQPDQDVVAGRASGGLRAGSPGSAGAADRHPAALADGHLAVDRRRGMLCAPQRWAKPRRAPDSWRRCAQRWWPACGRRVSRPSTASPRSCYSPSVTPTLTRKHLHGKGIAVRRCDTFVGLDGEYLRAAVRPEWPVLVEAIADIGGAR